MVNNIGLLSDENSSLGTTAPGLGGNSGQAPANVSTNGRARLGPGFSFTGLITAIQNVSNSVLQIQQTIQASFISLSANNTFTGSNSFTKPVKTAAYTVSALPSVTLSDVGSIAYASNGRNTGEGSGSGTGCLVQVQDKSSTATWCAVWSGVAVTS
ncbi:MAG: hypothetical protein KGL39_03625 [Patescibacteria group bacterium]|nr:hypothetical protein [Patescibacteria group bacterium]